MKTIQKSLPVLIDTETPQEFEPTSRVDARRQVPVGLERRNQQHNNIVVSLYLSRPLLIGHYAKLAGSRNLSTRLVKQDVAAGT